MADYPDEKGVPIDSLPTQSEERRETASFVYQRLNEMKMNRGKLGDGKWDKWDQSFRNQPTGSPPEDWMANVFVPFVMSVELAILAEITDRRIRWHYLPTMPDDEPLIDMIEAIKDYSMDKGEWDDEFFRFVHDKIHYGTAIWKEVYREDRRVIREKKKGTKDEYEEKDIKEFQDVYGYKVDIRDFYLDDRVKGEGIKRAEDCIERQIMRIGLFRTRYGKYKKSGKVKEYGFIKPVLSADKIKKFPPGGDTTQDSAYLPISEMNGDEVEVLEYWNKLKDQHIIVANGIVVVDEPIPYEHKQLPYIIDVAIPIPNSPYGMGIPEVLESPQEELNTTHNIMLDTNKLDLMRPTFMGGMTLLDEDEYQLRPKGIIPVDDVSQIKEMPSNGVQAPHFQMFEEIKQTIRTAAGLDVRFAEATSPGGGTDTATEVLRLQEASLRRIGLFQKMLEIRSIPRIAKLRAMNIMQFYRDPLRVEAVLGPHKEVVIDELTGKPKFRKVNRKIRTEKEGKTNYDFIEITPDDIRWIDLDVRVVGQTTQPHSAAIIAKRVNTALQTVLAYPQALEVVDLTELMRQFMKALDLPMAIVRDVINQPENNDIALAAEENQLLSQGEKVPATTNPSEKHTAVHGAYIYKLDELGRQVGGYTETFAALPPKAKEAFLAHFQGEMKQHAAKGRVSGGGARTPSPGGTGGQSMTMQPDNAMMTQEGVM